MMELIIVCLVGVFCICAGICGLVFAFCTYKTWLMLISTLTICGGIGLVSGAIAVLLG